MINNRDEEVLKEFGIHLRSLRLQAKLSQIELANKAGLSKNQIGNIESGEVNITLSTAKKISVILNIKLSELFSI